MQPHLYLDTNVILDAVLQRAAGEHSRRVIQRIATHSWLCSTSRFAFMEMCDALQEDQFVQNQLGEGLILSEVTRRLGMRRKRKYALKRTEIVEIYTRLWTTINDQYPFIDFERPNRPEFWDQADVICGVTNLGATDAIHVATALGAKCDLLVTRDEDFVRIVRDEVPTQFRVLTVFPQNLDDGLHQAGFTIDHTGQASREAED